MDVLGIAKTTLMPCNDNQSMFDVYFGNFNLVRVIVPNGLPVIRINDVLLLNELGKNRNHEYLATNYQIVGRMIPL
ncbi:MULTISPECIES: hypothetical protein [Ligilactobacillus]|uniref:hypothetical protein n=1 Tax=Ligilactobacillus TaxID=2767887 RepID=UPI0024B8C506|nr:MULTISPECIES: hypothetical protein [Ligilactobacillus]MDO3392801.1 hypothetical protein [Ligilactobacillus sp. 110_WCHN]